MSVDPLVDETGQTYAYGADDPVNSDDPMGLASAGTVCGKYGPDSPQCKGAEQTTAQVTAGESADQVGANKPIIDIAGAVNDAVGNAVRAAANAIKTYGPVVYTIVSGALGCLAGAVFVGVAGTVVPIVGNGVGLVIGCVVGAAIAVVTGGPWTDNPDDYGITSAGASIPITCNEGASEP